MNDLGLSIGDRVRVGDGTRTAVVVGEALLPITSHTDYDQSGWMTSRGLTGTGPIVSGTDAEDYLLVRWRPGIDVPAAETRLRRIGGGDVFGQPATLPVAVTDLGRIEDLPLALAGFFALLACATVAHALVTTVRRRRHDLAVLRSIGFTRRQTRGAIAWQATLLAIVGVVVGVPLGIATGRLAWRWLADDFPIVVRAAARRPGRGARRLGRGPARQRAGGRACARGQSHPSRGGVAGRVAQSTSVTRWSSVRRRSASLPAGMATKSVAPIPASRCSCAVTDRSWPTTDTSAGPSAPSRSSTARYAGMSPYPRSCSPAFARPSGSSSVTIVGSATTTRGAARPAWRAAAPREWDDLTLEHDRAGAPRDGAVRHASGEIEHPGLQRGEQHRRRVGPCDGEATACGDGGAGDVDNALVQCGHQRVEVLTHVARGPVVRVSPRVLDGHPVRQPDAEQQPRVGGGVGGERLGRERERMARVGRDDRRAQLDAPRVTPDEREHRERVEAGALRQPH